MKTKILLSCFMATGLFSYSLGQGANNQEESSGTFVRNDGQLKDVNGNPRPELLYYGKFNEKQIYFSSEKASYVWFKKGDASMSIPDSIGRMDMEFVNSNNGVSLIADRQEQGVMNFYKPHIPNGVENVPSFEIITYKDLYPNTDIAVKKVEGKVEFEITLHPGADPNDIQFRFNGSGDIELEQNGNLRVDRPLGQMRFEKPTGRKIIGGVESPVSVTLIKNGNNLVGISIINFQSGKTHKIIIGEQRSVPTLPIDNFNRLSWSTYYSGTQSIFEDQCYGTHIDAADNIYYTGLTFTSDFPILNNAQQFFGGDRDAYVVKFNALRGRVFSTFYGGSDYEAGMDVKSDVNGAVFFVGTTKSSDFSDFPLINAYNQPALNGSYDAFIIKLTSSGNRVWATYFGGDGLEVANTLVFDQSSNLYVAGSAGGSTIGFTFANLSGGFNQTIPGTGFIAKFNPNGSQAWATLFNGNVHRCAVNSVGDLIIVGQTSTNGAINCSPDTNFPLCDPGNGAYVMNNSGGVDAFISRFNNAGVLQWSTQFGGSGDESTSNFFFASGRMSLALDNSNNIHIAGPTSSIDLPVLPLSGNSSAWFQGTYGGGMTDGFIAKFSNNGNHIWGTYFGGSLDDEITNIALTSSELFIIGTTRSNDLYTKNLAGSYYQPSFGGGSSDGFILQLINNVPEWSTYFGGSSVETPEAIAVNNSHIIVGGRTGNTLPTNDIPGTSDYFNGVFPGHECSFFTDFKSGSVYNAGPRSMMQMDSENDQLVIYPNPARDKLVIKGVANTDIKLFSVSGKLVYQGHVSSDEYSMDVHSFSKGMYILEISLAGETKQEKLIIE